MGDVRAIQTDDAPRAIGPYSQAVASDGWLFVSGQIPLVPTTGLMVEGGIVEQTQQVLQNLQAVLSAAGVGPESVVKTTIFLADMADFKAVNELYAKCFSGPTPPARATVQVAALPLGARVEIDAVARVPTR